MWVRDGTIVSPDGSVDIDIRDEQCKTWITVKSDTSDEAEKIAKAVLDALNK
ncbi:MAG: hypothetical protein AAF346_00095 [Pseudomonadota bacterium]